MTTMRESSAAETAAWKFTDRANAEAYIASVCFKHGPPELVGIELEWTVHHLDDPFRPLNAPELARALKQYAPETLFPPVAEQRRPGGIGCTSPPPRCLRWWLTEGCE